MSQNKKKYGPTTSFGLGYFKPISMPATTLTQTYKIWTKKLADSGFNDIEMKSHASPGKVLPIFKYGGSASAIINKYNSSAEDYYSQCRAFTHAIDWRSYFGKPAPVLRYIWQLYAEGVSIRNTAKALAGLPLPYPHNMHSIKPHYSFKQNRGIWWIHKQIHTVMPVFKSWLASQNEQDDIELAD
jgi:hypothetical protein